MNVFFYVPEPNEGDDSIYWIVEMAAAKTKTEVLRSMPDLSLRLSRPADGATILVLLISTEEELDKLVRLRHLLSDLPFILILPHRDNKTTSLGYALGPRFLTYMDANSWEVAAVLEKMIQNRSNEIVRI